MTAGYIYRITNTINGKVYIGQTSVSIAQRWRQHRWAAKKESTYPLYRAIKRYGSDKFSVECLEIVIGSRSDLVAAEIRFINSYSALSPKGYNLSSGGEGYDSSQSVVRERHDAAVRKSSSTTTWKSAQFEGAKKRLSDPEWVRNNREQLRRMHESQEWKEKNASTLKKLHKDPKFRLKHSEGVARRSDNPTWRAGNAEALAKGRAVQVAKALERDAQSSPKEALRRVRRRETNRKSRSKKVGRLEAT